MNLEALTIGAGAPDQVNVVIEVPIGGEPIKYEGDADGHPVHGTDRTDRGTRK